MLLDNIRNLNTAEDLVPVTLSDTIDTPEPFRALWIGVGGTLVYTSARLVKRTIADVPAGWFEVSGTRVWATGSTVSNVHAVV